MKQWILMWKNVYQEFGFKAVLDAFLGALVFSFLVMGPIYVILVEIMIVLFYKVITLALLLTIAVIFHNVLLHHLMRQALQLKRPEAESPYRKVLWVDMVILSGVFLVIGVLVLLVWIPMWIV